VDDISEIGISDILFMTFIISIMSVQHIGIDLDRFLRVVQIKTNGSCMEPYERVGKRG
jgi:hypothetical protein